MSLKCKCQSRLLERHGWTPPDPFLNLLISQWIRFLNKARGLNSTPNATRFRSRSGLATTDTHVFLFLSFLPPVEREGFKVTPGWTYTSFFWTEVKSVWLWEYYFEMHFTNLTVVFPWRNAWKPNELSGHGLRIQQEWSGEKRKLSERPAPKNGLFTHSVPRTFD